MTPPEVKFPCDWEFRMIYEAGAGEMLETDARRVFADFGISARFEPGGASGSGRYLTWRISAPVGSREELLKLSERLGRLPGVKFLL